MPRKAYPTPSAPTSPANGKFRSLGEIFLTMRRRAGKTQEEIAQKAGIQRNYLSMLERDLANPTYEVVIRVFAALGYQIQFVDQEAKPEAPAVGQTLQ